MESMQQHGTGEIVKALAFAFLIYVCWVLRKTLLIVYTGILFAVIFTPAVERIQRVRLWRWRPSRGEAILILVGATLAVLALVAFFMLPPIIGDAQSFSRDLPTQLQQLSQRIERLPFGNRVATHLGPNSLTADLEIVLQHILSVFRGLAMGVLEIALLVLLVGYFILEGPQSFHWALSLVPLTHRGRLQDTMAEAGRRVQKWLTGQLLLMLILGSSTTVVLGLLHVRYFYALGVFAGIANFVPVVGPVATVVVASLVAAMDSWLKLVGVLIFYFVYQQVENGYLTPRIMQSHVGLPAVAVIISLAIGGTLAGILGALVAVPTAALVGTIVSHYVVKNGDQHHTG